MTNWQTEFKQVGAIWIHDGSPERPHALLTSGLHSNGFVNCTFVTQSPALLHRIVTAEDGLKPQLPTEHVDWVIGSAYGAITLAHAVAQSLDARAGFTQKSDAGMELARFKVKPGERVLVVEDVISTGGSTLKTIKGIEAATDGKAEILPYIVCLVNRSGNDELGERQIKCLLRPSIKNWQPEECPLCKEGSKALRPKDHWNELTGQ